MARQKSYVREKAGWMKDKNPDSPDSIRSGDRTIHIRVYVKARYAFPATMTGHPPCVSFFFNTNTGKKKKMPITDITKPPMVPAANGNQKASLSVPTMNGIKPKIVETTVRKIGTILAFHALV